MSEQLLDTKVLLLFLQNDPNLPEGLARLIESPTRRSFISLASLWELSQKEQEGLVIFQEIFRPDFPEILKEEGFHILPLDWQTMQRANALPPHHHDATDRLLIAESIQRNMPILTLDHSFAPYNVQCISA